MLYTIAQAAKAMAVEQSIILKAIEDGHITATKDVSGEWHVEHVELNLLYLYLARLECTPKVRHGNSEKQ
jgi:excisionase family DNA binding protein